MQYDVIVIGGSYAGMAAALQLVRARRKVLVIDGGQRRNRFASHSHGFLGQDGVDPGEIARQAREQLRAYPTLSWHDGIAEAASGVRDEFIVRTADGQGHSGRRLLFATGVKDELPAIPGLTERWGKVVFHCPYCHGYELDRGRIGVIGTGPMSVHQAEMLTEWGDVTFLTNGVVELDASTRQILRDRGVTVEEGEIDRLDGEADVLMSDGRRLAFAGFFTATAARLQRHWLKKWVARPKKRRWASISVRMPQRKPQSRELMLAATSGASHIRYRWRLAMVHGLA